MKYPTNESLLDQKRELVVDARVLEGLKKSYLRDKRPTQTSATNDRSNLAQISKEKTSKWSNNLQNVRAQRLKEREERLVREEQERRKLDSQFQEELEENRRQIIERAESLLYQEKDYVKKFHSLLLRDVTLNEQDIQRDFRAKNKAKSGHYGNVKESFTILDSLESKGSIRSVENPTKDLLEQIREKKLKVEQEKKEKAYAATLMRQEADEFLQRSEQAKLDAIQSQRKHAAELNSMILNQQNNRIKDNDDKRKYQNRIDAERAEYENDLKRRSELQSKFIRKQIDDRNEFATMQESVIVHTFERKQRAQNAMESESNFIEKLTSSQLKDRNCSSEKEELIKQYNEALRKKQDEVALREEEKGRELEENRKAFEIFNAEIQLKKQAEIEKKKSLLEENRDLLKLKMSFASDKSAIAQEKDYTPSKETETFKKYIEKTLNLEWIAGNKRAQTVAQYAQQSQQSPFSS